MERTTPWRTTGSWQRARELTKTMEAVRSRRRMEWAHTVLGEQALERTDPGLVVTSLRRQHPDRGDEVVAKSLPPGPRRFDVGSGQAEGATLPGRFEHQLAIAPRDVARQVQHGHLTTPIMWSRVTSGTRSSSARASVPAGRSGSTR